MGKPYNGAADVYGEKRRNSCSKLRVAPMVLVLVVAAVVARRCVVWLLRRAVFSARLVRHRLESNLGVGGGVSVGTLEAEISTSWASWKLENCARDIHSHLTGGFAFNETMVVQRKSSEARCLLMWCISCVWWMFCFFVARRAGFSMILWEMTTMTKPFEMMGREEFLKEVVSFCCRAMAAHSLCFVCTALAKPISLPPFIGTDGVSLARLDEKHRWHVSGGKKEERGFRVAAALCSATHGKEHSVYWGREGDLRTRSTIEGRNRPGRRVCPTPGR